MLAVDAPHRELHRLLADLAGLALVDVGHAADEAALQVAEGVAAHPLDAQLGLDLLAQQVGQRAGARQLHVAVVVVLQVLGQLRQHRLPAGIVDALADGDHAAAVAGVHGLHVGEELAQIEHPLGQVDQVRTVVRKLLAQRAGGGQEARVPAHHHAQVDARQRGVVEVGAGKGLGHEARGRRKARRVVAADQVVVDRLGDVDAAQRVGRGLGLLADDAHRVRRVVAADVEEMPDAMRLQHLEDLLAVGQVGLVAGAAQGRRGRGRHQFEVVAGLLGQVDEVLVDDAAHAVARAVDQVDALVAARLHHHADEALVDHRGGAAALRDEDLVHGHGQLPATLRRLWTRGSVGRLWRGVAPPSGRCLAAVSLLSCR